MKDLYDRFTERARKVIDLAREEAVRFNHNYIGTEHILLGLVREGEGVAARVLSNLGVELTKVRTSVEFIIGRGERQIVGEIDLTPRANRVIELAVDEARQFGHHYTGTEHLLLGLVREGEGIAAGVIESLGVNLERVRSEVVKILTGSGASIGYGSLPRELPPRTLWKYATVQTIRGDDGAILVASLNGDEETFFESGTTPLHEALRVLGDASWELMGVDSPDREAPGLYVLKRSVTGHDGVHHRQDPLQ